MRKPVKNASSAVIPSARREASADSHTSRSAGVRITITCAAPGTTSPVSGPVSGASTFTGVSSAASTGSSASAARIASSNPASPSRPSSRAPALSMNPAETGIRNSMPITWADRWAGTFPYAGKITAAAFSCGP